MSLFLPRWSYFGQALLNKARSIEKVRASNRRLQAKFKAEESMRKTNHMYACYEVYVVSPEGVAERRFFYDE